MTRANAILILVLTLLILAGALPVTADDAAPAACDTSNAVTIIPWAGGDPIVQPQAFPFYCCKRTHCLNFIAIYDYWNSYCGYFDNCDGYPPCNRSWHWILGHSCDCQ